MSIFSVLIKAHGHAIVYGDEPLYLRMIHYGETSYVVCFRQFILDYGISGVKSGDVSGVIWIAEVNQCQLAIL